MPDTGSPPGPPAELAGTQPWPGFDKFSAVQGILDRNHALIAEIDQNHASRYPEGLQRNVVLIRELNENLTKVGDLYEELSGAFMQRVSSAQSVNPELTRNNSPDGENRWETTEREAV